MKNQNRSIQIIGTQRSGSNLLRLMLNQFSEVSAPHPPHVLKTFVPLLDKYGDLNRDENFYQLAVDVADFVNANPVVWSGVNLEAKELVREAKHKNLLSLYETLYITKARHDKANIWCCKSMFNEYFVEDLEANGIQPYYIYIYRDGRDVAASFKRAVIGPKHIYHIANKWKGDQLKALQVRSIVGKERFFSISYEDLVTNPAKMMKSLSDKLGLIYSDNLLEFYKSSESMNTAASGEMWKNVSRPIISNNIGKYNSELTESEINLFEVIAGDVLQRLGYHLQYLDEWKPKDFTHSEIDLFNYENTELQKSARAKASTHDLENRTRQEQIIAKIKQRTRY